MKNKYGLVKTGINRAIDLFRVCHPYSEITSPALRCRLQVPCLRPRAIGGSNGGNGERGAMNAT